MGEDHEGVCIDIGSGLETSLALPLLRAHHEHGSIGCAPSYSPLHLGHCRSALVLPGREKGIHNAFPEELEHSVGARTLARYLKRAKALSLNTQQAIREVLIEQKEPRPWEECFQGGLSPPPGLVHRHREPSPAAKLWRALSMLLQGSQALAVSPCLLMARAREKAEQRQAPFLV